jgi:hypothetical protein
MKTRTRKAIFAAFHPSPFFEAIASFAEAFALASDVFTSTKIDNRNRPRGRRSENDNDPGTVAGVWL